jgi:hypothetical protein
MAEIKLSRTEHELGLPWRQGHDSQAKPWSKKMSKNYRSAGSGRFVTKSQATRSPSTTVGETRGGGSTHGTHRSAVSGKFVTPNHAAKNPGKTIKDS